MGGVWSYLTGDSETLKQGVFYKAYRINDALGQKLIAVGIGKKQLFELHQIFLLIDKGQARPLTDNAPHDTHWSLYVSAIDNSGEINLMEFFDYVDLKRTHFSEKAFSVMDCDGSGEVDFVEFVLAVWNYCSFSRASLVRYAFDLYDSDGSGEIELAEASLCVREIWGGEWERNANAQKVLSKLEAIMRTSTNGRLSVQMFEDFSQTHPMLLFPAFQLQTEIQNRVLGERFWRNAARRRSLVDPKELNIQNFEQLVHHSQKVLLPAGDSLHDNIFEDVNAAPRERKRSSLQNLYLKAKRRTSTIFLDAKQNVAGASVDVTEEASSLPTQTSVKAFEPPPSTASTSSPKVKKQKAPTPKRPPPMETTTLPLANQSSFGATTPTASSVAERSPKKRKAKAKTPTTTTTALAKPDWVVEDVVEVH